MSKWPVDEPIDPKAPRINLRGVPPDPATFDGPLNVFIALHATAVANNTAEQTKQDYDALHPPATDAASWEELRQANKPVTEEVHDHPSVNEPQPQPQPQPVSAGSPVNYTAGIVDPEIQARVQRHHVRPSRYT